MKAAWDLWYVLCVCRDGRAKTMSLWTKALAGEEAALDSLLVPISRQLVDVYRESVDDYIDGLAHVATLPFAKRVMAKKFALLATLSQPKMKMDPVERLRKLCPDLDVFRARTFLNAIKAETAKLGKNGFDVEAYLQRCMMIYETT